MRPGTGSKIGPFGWSPIHPTLGSHEKLGAVALGCAPAWHKRPADMPHTSAYRFTGSEHIVAPPYANLFSGEAAHDVLGAFQEQLGRGAELALFQRDEGYWPARFRQVDRQRLER